MKKRHEQTDFFAKNPAVSISIPIAISTLSLKHCAFHKRGGQVLINRMSRLLQSRISDYKKIIKYVMFKGIFIDVNSLLDFQAVQIIIGNSEHYVH